MTSKGGEEVEVKGGDGRRLEWRREEKKIEQKGKKAKKED